jgi:hypothetical protein
MFLKIQDPRFFEGLLKGTGHNCGSDFRTELLFKSCVRTPTLMCSESSIMTLYHYQYFHPKIDSIKAIKANK